MDVPEALERTNNLQKIYKNNEIIKMRDALTSIACEMQRFEKESSAAVPPGYNDKEKVLVELLKCKTKIKSKNNRIQKLKKNLQTACFVAKVVASAKKDESGSLKWYLGSARNECTDLLEKYKNNIHIINSLSRENEILHNKLDNVANFIRLGYEVLLKMRDESSEEKSVLVQLKQLIKYCGVYYADYCNEHNECLRLEQKNSFLTNKIQILENNVQDLSEQIKTLIYNNSRLQRQNDLIQNKSTKTKLGNDVDATFSEVNMKTRVKESRSDVAANENKFIRESSYSHYKLNCEKDFDLSPHLSLVNKLLSDQDTLLKDLKILSQEFLE